MTGRYCRPVARLEVKRQLGRADIAAVSELLEVAHQVDHHHPLDEHRWLDLVQGGREGYAGLVAWEPGHPHPVGYAQLSQGPGLRGPNAESGLRGPNAGSGLRGPDAEAPADPAAPVN